MNVHLIFKWVMHNRKHDTFSAMTHAHLSNARHRVHRIAQGQECTALSTDKDDGHHVCVSTNASILFSMHEMMRSLVNPLNGRVNQASAIARLSAMTRTVRESSVMMPVRCI